MQETEIRVPTHRALLKCFADFQPISERCLFHWFIYKHCNHYKCSHTSLAQSLSSMLTLSGEAKGVRYIPHLEDSEILSSEFMREYFLLIGRMYT